jgi:sugar/nucleoside kinase (ribokinase family)
MSAPLWPGGGRDTEFDVVAIGQNSLDRVAVVGRIPAFGGKVAAREYHELPGGQIATAALACARLGLRTAYLGSVGADEAGERVLEPLRAAGIDCSGVRRVEGARTQLAVILVDGETGERSVIWYRDPLLSLAPQDLDLDRIRSARALLLDAGDPSTATTAARRAREAGAAVVLDADTLAPGLVELLAQVDFPIVSRAFAEAFGEGRTVRGGLDAIAARGSRLAVVTLGASGAVARAGERVIESPAFRVEVVDTTGAGDVFHAAFAWGLLGGGDAEKVLRTAGAAAALACRALGAQGGLPTRDDLEHFLRQQP